MDQSDDLDLLWLVPTDDLRRAALHVARTHSRAGIAAARLFRRLSGGAMGFASGGKGGRWPREMLADDALQRAALFLDLADELDGLAGSVPGAGTNAKG